MMSFRFACLPVGRSGIFLQSVIPAISDQPSAISDQKRIVGNKQQKVSRSNDDSTTS